MQQNTEDWIKYRFEGIGASDAPCIMGKSEFKNIYQLWEEKSLKKQIVEFDEFITEKGHRIEEFARGSLEFKTGLKWPPALFENKQFPFIRASLDGWNEERLEFWECKYIGKEFWEKAQDINLSIRERIPEKYFDQIMQQFFCTGAKSCILTLVMEDSSREKHIYDFKIPFIEEFGSYITETLVPSLFDFWKMVIDNKAPEVTSPDSVVVENEELINLIKKYDEKLKEQKELEKKSKKESSLIMGNIKDQVEDIKRTILTHESRKFDKMEYKGFSLIQVNGPSKIDYESAFYQLNNWLVSIKGLDPNSIKDSLSWVSENPPLEKFTTAGKPSFKILVPKKVKKKEDTENKQLNDDNNSFESPLLELLENFIIPETGKKPRGWKTKNVEQRIKFLKGLVKRMKVEEEILKVENFIVQLVSLTANQ